MIKAPKQKKRVLTVTVCPETMDSIRRHRMKLGVSTSWLVDTLLKNYLKTWEEVKQK